MTRARKAKAPVPGASRVYVLTPSSEPDAYAWAAAKQTSKGWEVIEQDYRICPAQGAWRMVELWAIAPAVN